MELGIWKQVSRPTLPPVGCHPISRADGTNLLFPVSSYRVGLDVSIALEFRTSRTNGVLLTVSSQTNQGLGLEIVEGKVLHESFLSQ